MPHGFLKCECEHCNGHIEYPVESAGEVVRCPHCQLPTPLSVPGGEEESGIEIGGSQAKFVMVGLGILLVVAIVVSGAVFYVGQKKKNNNPPPPAAPQAEGAAPAAVPVVATSVPSGAWQQVKPFVGKFQGGYSASQVTEGRYVLAGPCTDCHKIYDPVRFRRSEWDNTLANMRGRAKLRGNEYDSIKRFVASIRL